MNETIKTEKPVLAKNLNHMTDEEVAQHAGRDAWFACGSGNERGWTVGAWEAGNKHNDPTIGPICSFAFHFTEDEAMVICRLHNHAIAELLFVNPAPYYTTREGHDLFCVCDICTGKEEEDGRHPGNL